MNFSISSFFSKTSIVEVEITDLLGSTSKSQMRVKGKLAHLSFPTRKKVCRFAPERLKNLDGREGWSVFKSLAQHLQDREMKKYSTGVN